MILVINEWIFHDLLGENGPKAFVEADNFIQKLFQSDDSIVMPFEQRWRGKAYQLMTSPSAGIRQVSQLFHRLLRDSNRCIVVNHDDISSVPEGEYDWAPTEDVYLLQAYDASKADLLVTTDETLFERVVEHGQFTCQMRDEFLASYGPTLQKQPADAPRSDPR